LQEIVSRDLHLQNVAMQTRRGVADTRGVWIQLFPSVCLGCGVLLREEVVLPLCSRCRPQQARLPDTLANQLLDPCDGVRAAWDYDGPLQRPVTSLKFSGALALAGPLGRLLADDPWLRHGPTGQPADIVIPVPLHWRRRFVRGFDQSAELSRWALLHTRQRSRLVTRALVRSRWTRPQTELTAHARAGNLDGAFVVRRPELIAGRSVLLIDDVTTTGATFRACAEALREAGATSVHALALLRSL
jgi:ComF family protein